MDADERIAALARAIAARDPAAFLAWAERFADAIDDDDLRDVVRQLREER